MSTPLSSPGSPDPAAYDQISRLQEELSDARNSGDQEREIDLLLRIAAVADTVDDWGETNAHLHFAARLMRRSGKRLEKLHDALGKRAQLMRDAKRLDQSLSFYEQAESAAKQYSGALEAARWKGKQGTIHRLRKEYDLARECHEESLRMLDDAGQPAYAERAEQEGCLGLVDQAGGEIDGTLKHYARAVDFAARSKDLDAIYIWNKNIANELTRRRLYARAWKSYSRSFSAARRKADEALLYQVSVAWSTSYVEAHRRDLSITRLRLAAEMMKEPRRRLSLLTIVLVDLQVMDRRRELASTLSAAQRIAGRLGLDHDAFATARDYLERNRKPRTKARQSNSSDDEGTVLETFIAANMAAAMESGNVDRMKQLAHLICDVNSALPVPSDDQWRPYLSNPQVRHQVIADTLDAMASASRHREGVELSQRFKGAGFAVLSLKRLREQTRIPKESAHFLSALAELAKKVRALSQSADRVNVPGPLIESVRAAGEKLLEAGALLREQDRVLHASLGGTILPSDIVDALPMGDGVAVFDFFVGDRRTVVYILYRTRNGIETMAGFTEFCRKDCANGIRDLLENRVHREISPRQRDALLNIGKLLHDRLLCSLTQTTYRLGITQFILIPGPGLSALPFASTLLCAEKMHIPGVTDGSEQFLGEVYPFEFVPCLQAVAVSQHQKRPRKISKVLSIANPVEDLPGAQYTAVKLQRSFFKKLGSVTLTGSQATADAFFEQARDANIIVLATHGSLNLADPGASSIRFHDTPVSLDAIIRRCRFQSSPIVILSTCEVGALSPLADPTLGLIPGALIAAGAASVIASLWPVVDLSTGYLVERLLHYLAYPGFRPAAALFRALRDLRNWPLEDALRYCAETKKRMEKDGAADRFPLEYIRVDHLQGVLRKMNVPRPFSGPEMWAAFAVYGSGWSAPAGASVGSGDDFMDREVRYMRVSEMVESGQFDTALKEIETLLSAAQGEQRARILELKAVSVWADGKRANRESSKAEALELLSQATFTAQAEENDQLLRNIHATRQKIEL